jgi:hypothetical protein
MLFEGQVDITRQEDRVGRWMDTRIRMKVGYDGQRLIVLIYRKISISPLEHDQINITGYFH